jgi:hypothetical protein
VTALPFHRTEAAVASQFSSRAKGGAIARSDAGMADRVRKMKWREVNSDLRIALVKTLTSPQPWIGWGTAL